MQNDLEYEISRLPWCESGRRYKTEYLDDDLKIFKRGDVAEMRAIQDEAFTEAARLNTKGLKMITEEGKTPSEADDSLQHVLEKRFSIFSAAIRVREEELKLDENNKSLSSTGGGGSSANPRPTGGSNSNKERFQLFWNKLNNRRGPSRQR